MIKQRYESLKSARQAFINTAEDCAKLTIPSVFPEHGLGDGENLHRPNQSLGARGVANLSARLMMALLPPNRPFFRFRPKPAEYMRLQEAGPEVESEVEAALVDAEQATMKAIDSANIRRQIFLAARLLVVTGNALMILREDNTLQIMNLRQYAVARDMSGQVQEIITHESLAWERLSDELKARVEKPDDSPSSSNYARESDPSSVDLYTSSRFDGERWQFTQEVKDTVVSKGEYKAGNHPYIPLRWNSLPGEDYGRGHVEELLGDLAALDSLSESIEQVAAASAMLLGLVNPAGVTKIEDIAKAENLEFIQGVEEDVSFLKVEKFSDMSVAGQSALQLRQAVGQAFLLNTSLQRDGERVTATEIRVMAQELEGTLGGVFTHLAGEMQGPLLRRLVSQLKQQRALPDFPEGLVDFEILTGLEALGREADLVRIQQFLSFLQGMPPEVLGVLRWEGMMRKAASALSLDIDDVIMTREEIEEQERRAAEARAIEQANTSAAQSGGQALGQAMTQQFTGG